MPLNKRHPEAKAAIYCRIKIDGIASNDFSTFIQILPGSWDSTKQQIRGNSFRVHDDNEVADKFGTKSQCN